MSESNAGVAKVVGLAATVAAVALIFFLMDSGSLEVAGMSIPAWLLAIVCYVLGALAVWGTTKGQKG